MAVRVVIRILCLTIGIAILADGRPVLAGHDATLTLDGETYKVQWVDGDSFRSREKGKKLKARITDFNTLESYGPIHKWGEWTANQLSAIADLATATARSGSWTCHYRRNAAGEPQRDGYGRGLISCPDLAAALVERGLAHVFAMEEAHVDSKLIALQHAAQKAAKGMWKKGVPKGIVTSVHSGDEKPDKPDWKPYNRVSDTASGLAIAREHASVYKECDEVCVDGSCMLYVPYKRRYGKNRASCLK